MASGHVSDQRIDARPGPAPGQPCPCECHPALADERVHPLGVLPRAAPKRHVEPCFVMCPENISEFPEKRVVILLLNEHRLPDAHRLGLGLGVKAP